MLRQCKYASLQYGSGRVSARNAMSASSVDVALARARNGGERELNVLEDSTGGARGAM